MEKYERAVLEVFWLQSDVICDSGCGTDIPQLVEVLHYDPPTPPCRPVG